MTRGARAGADQAARDAAFMRRALRLARRGWGQTAPNPMVGAVVVRDGEIVGEGWHARFGEPHAEVAALRAAGERARGATVYVSLEPCAHHGKTPPCAEALLHAGVRRVVAAIGDPNPEAQGGLARLAAAGVETSIGVEADAARELNAAFVHSFASSRPWVTLKLALSIDGAIADHTRQPGWLTNPQSRREVHRLRAGNDAIAVGIGTVIADDPSLTVRGVPAPRVPPLRVVFDRSGSLPLDSLLARTAGETPVAVLAETLPGSRETALRDAGVQLMVAEGLEQQLQALRARGVRSLLVEGGATLASALLGRGLVDRMVIFQAPVVLGARALNAFAQAPAARAAQASRLAVIERRAFGDDLMTVYGITSLSPPGAS